MLRVCVFQNHRQPPAALEHRPTLHLRFSKLLDFLKGFKSCLKLLPNRLELGGVAP